MRILFDRRVVAVAGVLLLGMATLSFAADPSGQPAESRMKPLKVYILAGQSNMQGHARISTFDSMADDPKTAPLLKQMRNTDRTPKVCQKVWISSVGCLGDAYTDLTEKTGRLTAGYGAPQDKIGPEFTFGLTLETRLNEPALIIKTAWGGRSLHTDFRPPSAGEENPNPFMLDQWKKRGVNPDQETEKLRKNGGVYYRHMIDHVQMVFKDIKRVAPDYDPRQGYELAGFVWFQGFNDYVDHSTYPDADKPGGYDLYAELLEDFIRDVRKDLAAPKMPFVIGVMGIDGEKGNLKAPMMHFRQAQRKPPTLEEFQGNVTAVETWPFWDDELDALAQRKQRLFDQLERVFRKTPHITEAAKEEARGEAMAKEFTPQELTKLKGVSNGGYHYLGAAKILAPIGRAFAEPLLVPAP